MKVSVKQSPRLDDLVNHATFSGILGINTATLYEYKERGILPNSDFTYRQGLEQYISWVKNKAAGRNSDTATAVAEQKMRLDAAKTALTWLMVQEKRNQLVDKTEFLNIFEPLMLNLRDGMLKIANDFPEVEVAVVKLLTEMADVGNTLAEDAFTQKVALQDELSEEVDIPDQVVESFLTSLVLEDG